MNKKTIIIVSSLTLIVGGVIAYLTLNNSSKKGTRTVKGEDGKVTVDSQTAGLIGKTVNVSDLGYTNIRSTSKIDDGYIGEWFGARIGGNVIGEVDSNPIGTIKDTKSGDDGFIWYKVKLTKSIEGKSEGWVREDAVNLK